MPDSSGGPITVPKDSGGGIPKWIMYGGGIVAAIALFTLARKQSGTGGSTAAAGTSINAALGSLAEGQQQIQGQIGTSLSQVSDSIAAQGMALDQQGATIETAINAQTQGISSQLNQIANAQDAHISDTKANALAQQQSEFKSYATGTFGYKSGDYLALPAGESDFLNFQANPSLANPAYQTELIRSRGWVFDSTTNNAPHLGTAMVGTH